jgi:hypothetical protein
MWYVEGQTTRDDKNLTFDILCITNILDNGYNIKF